METSATASPARDKTNAGKLANSNALPSLLVIDDDPVHRMVISKVGEKAGYAITSVGSIGRRDGQNQAEKIRLHFARSVARRKKRCIASQRHRRAQREAMLIVISGATAASARGHARARVEASPERGGSAKAGRSRGPARQAAASRRRVHTAVSVVRSASKAADSLGGAAAVGALRLVAAASVKQASRRSTSNAVVRR